MAENKSIKISPASYNALKELSKIEKESMQAILDKLLKEYQTKKFFENVESAYKNMSEKEWEEEIQERRLFDKALMDDMEEETDETW